MAKFRYKGVVVSGETVDADGVTIPNIIESITAYGYEFSKRQYTEVPDDAVAVQGRRLDRMEGKLVPYQALIVDKLRGNPHFEEKVEKQEVAA